MIDECLRVTFEVESDDCPLSEAATATDIPIEAQPPQLRADGNALLKFSASRRGALCEHLDDDDRITFLHVAESDGTYVYRCLSKQRCVVHDLIDRGFLPDSLQYRKGSAVFFGAIVDREMLRDMVDRPAGNETVKLRNVALVDTEVVESAYRLWNVTERQEQCLRTAVEMGYFALPREADASDVAGELGISKSAFFERLRRAERNIFERIFV